jgi:hypothetical protein
MDMISDTSLKTRITKVLNILVTCICYLVLNNRETRESPKEKKKKRMTNECSRPLLSEKKRK